MSPTQLIGRERPLPDRMSPLIGRQVLVERRRAVAREAALRAIADIPLGPGSREFCDSLEIYRCSMRSLLALFPERRIWELEREILPEEVLAPRLSLFGLPETAVPFSLYGDWENPTLEGMIRAHLVDDGRAGSCSILLARMLDRFTESSLPLENIGGFYRPAAAHLRAFDRARRDYLEEVLAVACALADQFFSTYPSGKSNHLKSSIHKSISTKTGVHLSEIHSSSSRPKKSGPCSSPARYLRGSAVLRLGLDPLAGPLPPEYGWRARLPGFEKPARLKVPDVGFLISVSIMRPVLRSGSETRYSHPALPGMEFGPAQCGAAAAAAVAAGRKIARMPAPSAPVAEGATISDSLCASEEFRKAFDSEDFEAQMSIALVAGAIRERAAQVAERFSSADPIRQASDDLDTAFSYVEEYLNFPDNPAMALRSVRRMLELSRKVEFQHLSPYELALIALDERLERKETPKTLIPERTSAPPPADAQIPRAPPLPADLIQVAEEGEEPTQEIALAPEEPAPAETAGAGQAPEETEVEEPTEEIQIDVEEPEDEAAPPWAGEPEVAGPAVAPEDEPEKAALPKFDFPFPNSVYDTNLEKILPPKTGPDGLPDEKATLVRRVARALVTYRMHDFHDGNIDARCLGSVQSLRKAYSPAAALACAEAIVDGHGSAPQEEGAAESEAGAAGEAKLVEIGQPSAHVMLERLDESAREIVAAVMGADSCTARTLEYFLALAPGYRELCIRNYISSRWTEGDFTTDIPRFRKARDTLYSACSLREPTEAEKLEAARDPMHLSERQRHFIDSLLHGGRPLLRAQDAEAFAVWVNADPASEQGRRALEDFWKANMAAASNEDKYVIGSSFWLNTPREDRLRFWKLLDSDLLSAGSLAHRLRFGNGSRMSLDEAGVAARAYGKTVREAYTLSTQTMEQLSAALTKHTYGGDVKEYFPEALRLAGMGPLMAHSRLKEDARLEMEYNTLIEFLGVKMEAPACELIDRGYSRPKRKNGSYGPNEDSYSSARVMLPDGGVLLLDMVADGMGGHSQGSNGDKTNGQVASGIAKEVFEVAAMAGWIRTPEDARKLIFIADQAVVAEQIRTKARNQATREVTKEWADQGVDVQNMHPEWAPEFTRQVETRFLERLAAIDSTQTNNMGTTMVISMQKGGDAWFIHCGDSDAMLLRGGKPLFATEGHSFAMQLRIDAERSVREKLSGEWSLSGIDVTALDAAQSAEFERQFRERHSEIMEQHGVAIENFKNVIVSAVGVHPSFVHINNMDGGYSPIKVKPSDAFLLCSDGLTVPVCTHEIPAVIFRKSLGDLEAAREALVELADSRPNSKMHKTMCECGERPGKNDDKTVIVRYGFEGLMAEAPSESRFLWLTGPLKDDPVGLALSSDYRMFLEGLSDMATGQERVIEALSTLVSASEESSPGSSRNSYLLTLSSVFSVVSKREDGYSLLVDMAQPMGSWSGLMLKKLREAPDASLSRRAMFDFVRFSVPHAELAPLLGGLAKEAKNPDIAKWARIALSQTGSPVEEPEPSAFEKPPPAESIFNSQLDVLGRPLDASATRYLDSIVLDVQGSTVMQDVANTLGILPRDLEIMVFFAYSGYKQDVAIGTHMSMEGQQLIPEVACHLASGDAERILVSSYILYMLKEWDLTPTDRRRLSGQLLEYTRTMDKGAPYAAMFHELSSPFLQPGVGN